MIHKGVRQAVARHVKLRIQSLGGSKAIQACYGNISKADGIRLKVRPRSVPYDWVEHERVADGFVIAAHTTIMLDDIVLDSILQVKGPVPPFACRYGPCRGSFERAGHKIESLAEALFHKLASDVAAVPR